MGLEGDSHLEIMHARDILSKNLKVGQYLDVDGNMK